MNLLTRPRPMNVHVGRGSPAEAKYRAMAGVPGLKPEALAPGIAPSPSHDLIYHGGRTIPSFGYASLYVGGDAWSAADIASIDTALANAMTEPTLNNVMAQYFAALPVTKPQPSRRLPGAAPVRASQGDVEAWLKDLAQRGQLGGYDPAATVFNFMLPQGTVLSDSPAVGGAQGARPGVARSGVDDEADSLHGLGGFHGSIAVGASTLYYAVGVYSERRADGTQNGIVAFDQPWKNVVATFYHELNEARTDPDVQQVIAGGPATLLGWTSRSGEECGDYPVFEANPLSLVFQEVALTRGGTAPVQFQYSNYVHGPEGPVATPRPPAATGGSTRARPGSKPAGSHHASAAQSPIEHVILIVKENHTFDHYFGTFPGAAGATLGPAVDPEIPDPLHDHEAWLHRNDAPPRGAVRMQYARGDIPAYWALAQQYTLCDHYHSEIASQSEPNHLVLITGGTPLIDNSSPHRSYQPQPPFDVNSLPAQLKAAGYEWRAYSDDPLATYFRHVKALAGDPWNVNGSEFDADAARGTLPAVSWLYAPGAFSEHPGPADGKANVGPGSQWTAARVAAIANGPLWPRTAIFITWDDYGGHADHVVPPNALQWTQAGPPGYQGSQFRYGSRVPCLVVSPYAKAGINSTFHSHVSLVKFCLRNFALPPLGAFDALPGDRSDDMWDCFDFSAPPRLAVPSTQPA